MDTPRIRPFNLGTPDQRRRLKRKLAWLVRRTKHKLRTTTPWLTKLDRSFRRPTIAKDAVPKGPVVHPEIRAAVILDEFSELAFQYEWTQVLITPDNWRKQLQDQDIDLLFVESAWRGNRETWRAALTNTPSPELRELLAWCQSEAIPTVFWNKEDPPNYELFLETAKLFDHVFTVDEDCLDRYQQDLGHDRVALLQFAAQPRIHNPIRRDTGGAQRPYGVAFAGTYFNDKHPERREQLEMLLEPARSHGLHIYSRMQREGSEYRFPARFAGHIVGSLPYQRMVNAFSSYQVFLNVNSVTTSPTMCARRLFELSAAQTPVLSTPAAAIEPVFGDSVVVATSAEEAGTQLGNLLRNKQWRDRLGLQAHRLVHEKHLYGHRVSTIMNALGVDITSLAPSVSAIVPTMRPQQLAPIWKLLHHQTCKNLELVLLTHGFDCTDSREVAELRERWPLKHVEIVPMETSAKLGELMNKGVQIASGDYVAKIDDDNYYGPNYLSDLLAAFSWTDAQVVGKWAHYVHIGDETGPTVLRFADSEHRYVKLVQGGTILTPREVALDIEFEPLPRRVDTTFLEKVRASGGLVYASDRFNFVSNRTNDASGHTWGISTADLLSRSSAIEFYGPAIQHVTC